MKVTRIVVATVVLAGIATSALAVKKGKAKFIGATFEAAGLKEKKDYPIDLKADDRLVYADGALEIPWAAMEDVEYGQKVGHRIGTAILLSPLALFKKARHHYVTIAYADDDGTDQAIVIEFDKGDIRMALATFRARTGKNITYQDEEAEKQMGGGNDKKEEKGEDDEEEDEE